MKTILVPLDGSAGSETVLETIGEIARGEDASVRLLSVHAPVHEVEADGRILAFVDQEMERSKRRPARTSSAWSRALAQSQ